MAGIDQSWIDSDWLQRANRAAAKAMPYVPKRRATSKTDLVEDYIAGPGTEDWSFITGGPFRGSRGVPLYLVEDTGGGDEPPREAVLSVKLQPEELDLAKDESGRAVLRDTMDEYGFVVVPDSAAMWATSALGFQKTTLVLDGKVRAELLEHDDANDIFADLVWLGKADKDEMFAAKIAWLALVGIRAANDPDRFGPSLLAPIQDPNRRIKQGWHMDPVIEYMLRVRDAGISSSTAADSAEIFEIKDEMRVFLYGIADRFYVQQKLTPKWHDGRLDHKNISKAVDDRVWLFKEDRRATIAEWRRRADRCILHQLRKKAARWDLSRSDVDRALASDLLYQWMSEEEREKQEKAIYHWVDSYLFSEAVHFSHCLFGFGTSQARKLISDGYATVWSEDAVKECEFLLDFAWECDRASAVWSLLKRYDPNYGLGAFSFEEDKAAEAVIRAYESGKIAMADVTWLSDRFSLEIRSGAGEGADADLLSLVRDRYQRGKNGQSKSVNWFATRGPGGVDRGGHDG